MFQGESNQKPRPYERDCERPRSIPAEPIAYRGGGRARRALDDTVELARAAHELISAAARRRILQLTEGLA